VRAGWESTRDRSTIIRGTHFVATRQTGSASSRFSFPYYRGDTSCVIGVVTILVASNQNRSADQTVCVSITAKPSVGVRRSLLAPPLLIMVKTVLPVKTQTRREARTQSHGSDPRLDLIARLPKENTHACGP
jgi:hypothetical protein